MNMFIHKNNIVVLKGGNVVTAQQKLIYVCIMCMSI